MKLFATDCVAGAFCRLVRMAGLSAILGLSLTAGSAAAQTPTYQGTLQSAGQKADGLYDFRVSLFAAASGGSALQTLTKPGVTVDGGVFTLPLDFDPQLFSGGGAKFVGVEVRPAGIGSYTTISPRQAVGAAAVALSVPGIVTVPSLTLDQDIAGDATATSSLSGSAWQSFTTTASGRLRSVTVRLTNDFPIGTQNLTATVYQGEGTSGAVLATGAGVVPGISGTPLLVTFPLNQGIVVNAADKLTVRLSSNIFVNWYLSAADSYAGGRSSVSATRDFALQSFVEAAGSTPSVDLPGGLTTSGLGVGDYQGGTAGSAIADFNKQVVVSGSYNTGANAGNGVKLLISDYDNEAGSNIYPIYVEDENNVVDFFVRKQGNANLGTTTGFLNGNLGLGTKSPAARLSISSGSITSTGYHMLITNTAVTNSSFNTGGVRMTNDGFFEVTNNANLGASAVLARLSSNGTWSSTSDRRMKSDIKSESSATLLDAALRLRPVTYYFNAEKDQHRLPKHPHLGLIAQEVQDVLPGLVESSSEMLTLDYSTLGVVAVGAVQEQQKKIDRLEYENRVLMERLERIEALLRDAATRR
ncbi:MAG: tail fiber domain-containing protein [Phycisphaerales bacterium]